jgi:RNase H-fold protein (predicted Holliday junction resolvase)
MKKIALDATCFIDAFNIKSHAYDSMQKIIEAYHSQKLVITVSRHTIYEIKSPPEAVNFANSLEILPYYPIGTWDEQVTSWKNVTGAWADAKENQKIQIVLKSLGTNNLSIRDRGAYLDALKAHVDMFVTSDTGLCGSSPSKRIEDEFGLRVVTPQEIANKL